LSLLVYNIILISLFIHQSSSLGTTHTFNHLLFSALFAEITHLHSTSSHSNFKMRFFATATFVLAATAAPLEQSETRESGSLEKRLDPITLAVVTAAAGAASAWATTETLNAIKGLVKDAKSFTEVGI
jgi:hypothetical protein